MKLTSVRNVCILIHSSDQEVCYQLMRTGLLLTMVQKYAISPCFLYLVARRPIQIRNNFQLNFQRTAQYVNLCIAFRWFLELSTSRCNRPLSSECRLLYPLNELTAPMSDLMIKLAGFNPKRLDPSHSP
jgi:hypothetical protein